MALPYRILCHLRLPVYTDVWSYVRWEWILYTMARCSMIKFLALAGFEPGTLPLQIQIPTFAAALPSVLSRGLGI